MIALRAGVTVYGGFAGTESTVASRPAPGTAPTILDGSPGGGIVAGHVVKLAGAATLDRLTLKGGNATSTVDYGFGGTVFGTAVTGAKLVDVTIQGGVAASGGGCVALNGSTVTFVGGTIIGCSAPVGAGIHGADGGGITLEGTLLQGNKATDGGAIYLTHSYSPAKPPTPLTAIGAVFRSNEASGSPVGRGGAIYALESTVKLDDSSFLDNYGSLSCPGLYLEGGTATVVNSLFALNRGFGAAITTTDASGPSRLTIVHSTFAFNDTSGCPEKCDVMGPGLGNGKLLNSTLVQSQKTAMFSSSIGTTRGSCSLFISGGLGQSPSPFVAAPRPDHDVDGVEDYLLEQPATNACLNVGVTDDADVALANWNKRTTSGNGCLDSGKPDAGRHYVSWLASAKACP